MLHNITTRSSLILPKRKLNWSGFGGIRARTYGLLYIILIPLYALIYANLPQYSFYHSTVKYEQSLNSDATQIIDEFKTNLVSRLRAAHPDNSVVINGWEIDISNISVSSLQATDDSVSFTVNTKMFKMISQKPVISIDRFKLTYPGNKYEGYLDKNGQIELYLKYPTFDPPIWKNNGDELDYQMIFPENQINMKSSQAILLLPAALNTKIEDFRRAYKGFPSKVSGNFIRMIYLSAITITTVGYGDILPISPLARVLVASEAVLGVVLIGLFLNALVQTRKTSP
jgi:Ion channel